MKIKSLTGETLHEAEGSLDEVVKDALFKNKKLNRAIIPNLNLMGIELPSGTSLQGTISNSSNFMRAKLPKLVISEGTFPEANFHLATIPNLFAAGANLARANFGNALEVVKMNAKESILIAARLGSTVFESGHFYRANLSKATAKNTKFVDCNMREAIATRIDAPKSDWSGSDCTKMIFAGGNLPDSKWHGTIISDVIFEGANLDRAEGLDPEAVSSLEFLRHQPGPIRMYVGQPKEEAKEEVKEESRQLTEEELQMQEIRKRSSKMMGSRVGSTECPEQSKAKEQIKIAFTVGGEYTAPKDNPFPVHAKSKLLKDQTEYEKIFMVEFEPESILEGTVGIPLGSSDTVYVNRFRVFRKEPQESSNRLH